ncbi:MAG: hypothetical protein CSA38_02030 [Flavobacteriales bacterium]|nr:MAG: hypothetical protein CSA38_02030 [Flavobacteriales bacterium]
MNEKLKELQNIFAIINKRKFCEKYGIPYYRFTLVIDGKVNLTEKNYKRIKDALAKFKEEL